MLRLLLKKALEVPFLIFLLFLKMTQRFFSVRTFISNQSLFGHLALEPEKYLSAKDISSPMSEIGFKEKKLPSEIFCFTAPIHKARFTLDLWTFGKKNSQANSALVKMWKRKLLVVPSFIVDLLLKANQRFANPPIVDYRFSTLLSAEKNIDSTRSHLEFSNDEIEKGGKLLLDLGIPTGAPYICIVSREGGNGESQLRNRSINDFSEMNTEFARRGYAVVRLGGAGSSRLEHTNKQIIDYANSKYKSAEGDIFLAANCKFMVSTMTGPDALALAFRKRVLLLDVPHYGLVFSGTELVTWVPAVLKRDKERLSLQKVFECGAGWYWNDSHFDDAGLQVFKSSPTEIATYGIQMLETVDSTEPRFESPLLLRYRTVMQSAMGELGKSWHGPVRSSVPEEFLSKNKDWFLS
jgi:putative glycosyltransferase (TIGR04372 family)